MGRRALTGRMRRLSTEMDEVGTEMELVEWRENGVELRGAARLMREWADMADAEIDDEEGPSSADD